MPDITVHKGSVLPELTRHNKPKDKRLENRVIVRCQEKPLNMSKIETESEKGKGTEQFSPRFHLVLCEKVCNCKHNLNNENHNFDFGFHLTLTPFILLKLNSSLFLV